MPNYYGNALYDVSLILRDLGYGYRGNAGTNATDEDARRIGQWGTNDQQFVLGQRSTPGNMTLGRIRIATAIRAAMGSGGRSRMIGIWFDVDPTDQLPFGTTVHRVENIRDGLGSIANALYFVLARDLGGISAHFIASVPTMEPRPLGEDELRSAQGQIAADLVFNPADTNPVNAGEFAGTLTPSEALLEALPSRARVYATVTVVLPRVGQNGNTDTYWEVDNDSWTMRYPAGDGAGRAQRAAAALNLTGQGMIEAARESYRIWLRMQWRRPVDTGEAQRLAKIEEHRRLSKRRFETFRSSKAASEIEVIPTLPFLPHGLASSRRWGIEIESGGARGIEAPAGGWSRKGDGSLRSAWDGYREVQDFEPYDREEAIDISWHDCENYENHMPHEQYYDDARREYAFRVNANYVPVAECQSCGQRTRVVRVEPQTITHRAQRDDCAEFVSPILISMHSNGLHTLLEQISLQPQNDTAGVHVHVEANDLNDTQIATLIYGYDMLEPIIEKSYRRNRRDYCARRTSENVLNAARAVKNKTAADVRGGNRYVTVNTNSLSRHGTIEFRAMGPVYDYNHLIRWAMFCREMVNSVKAGATQKDFGRVKKWEDVLSIFTRFGKEFVRAAIYEMTGEVGEAARLSKEGTALTTEAVNADLNAAFADITAFLTTASREARTAQENIRGFGYAVSSATDVNTIQNRLVTSDGRLTTV